MQDMLASAGVENLVKQMLGAVGFLYSMHKLWKHSYGIFCKDCLDEAADLRKRLETALKEREVLLVENAKLKGMNPSTDTRGPNGTERRNGVQNRRGNKRGGGGRRSGD